MFRLLDVDDQELVLVHDDKDYTNKVFLLRLTDSDGMQLEIELDGIMVGDIIADARDAGMPVGWEFWDGTPLHKDGEHHYPPEPEITLQKPEPKTEYCKWG